MAYKQLSASHEEQQARSLLPKSQRKRLPDHSNLIALHKALHGLTQLEVFKCKAIETSLRKHHRVPSLDDACRFSYGLTALHRLDFDGFQAHAAFVNAFHDSPLQHVSLILHEDLRTGPPPVASAEHAVPARPVEAVQRLVEQHSDILNKVDVHLPRGQRSRVEWESVKRSCQNSGIRFKLQHDVVERFLGM